MFLKVLQVLWIVQIGKLIQPQPSEGLLSATADVVILEEDPTTTIVSVHNSLSQLVMLILYYCKPHVVTDFVLVSDLRVWVLSNCMYSCDSLRESGLLSEARLCFEWETADLVPICQSSVDATFVRDPLWSRMNKQRQPCGTSQTS